MSAEFLVTALVVALIPGTGVVYTVSTGLFVGRRASVWACAGNTLGIVPHLAAAIFGLSAVMNTTAHAFQVLRWAGVAYLLFLAWGMWRSTGALSFRAPTEARTARQLVVRGALINLLNPKLTLFFFALLPQFVDVDAASTPQMVWLGAVFMLVTFVVFVGYGVLASAVRDRVVRSPTTVQRLQRSFAGLFALLGLRLALDDR